MWLDIPVELEKVWSDGGPVPDDVVLPLALCQSNVSFCELLHEHLSTSKLQLPGNEKKKRINKHVSANIINDYEHCTCICWLST
jgi:hypothetical protein